MTDKLVIRTATLDDVQTVARHGAAIARETENAELDMARVSTAVTTVVNDPSKGRYLLAEAEGKPVGTLMIQKEWSDWRNAEYWWIHSVYVEPEERRRGVFKQMFDHVESEARAAGAAGLKLYTESSNERAHKAYRERGMESHAVVFERVWVPY